MKTPQEAKLPSWFTYTLIISLGCILLLMPVHALLSTWGGTTVGPLWLWKSWKEILLAIVSAVTLGWIVSTPSVWRGLFSDRIIQLAIGFVVLVFVIAALNASVVGLEATAVGVAGLLRYLVAAFLAFILFRFGNVSWKKIARHLGMTIITIGAIVSAIGLLQVTVLPRDLFEHFGYEKGVTIAPFMTIDENPDAPRAFSTLRGPNEFGAYLIVPLILALVLVRHIGWRVMLAVLIGAGIFASVSRSAWIGTVVALTALAVLSYGLGIVRTKRFVFGVLAVVVLTCGLIVSAMSVPSLRLAIFRSSPTDTSLTEGSTDLHLLTTVGGVQRVATNPFGCGPGCSGPASFYSDDAKLSENYYVQVAEETGLIGLGLWLAVAWQVIRRLYEYKKDMVVRGLLASFVGLSVIGLWLHVWADDPLSLTWWGLAGAALGYYASASRAKALR